VTAAENPSRSTASAPPAGTWFGVGRAHDQRAQPAHFGMQQSTALLAASSERNELEQTSSARPSV